MTDLLADQKRHSEILNEMTEKCTAEGKFRAAEVSDADKAINAAAAEKRVCQTKLDNAEKLKKESENLLQDEKTNYLHL
jgi:hypothetical protein